jgi:hypothetical protein
MRQGKASRDGDYGQKREPIVHSINPGWAGQLGNKVGSHVTDRKHETGYSGEEMYKGKGFGPPPLKSMKTSNNGSQGSY